MTYLDGYGSLQDARTIQNILKSRGVKSKIYPPRTSQDYYELDINYKDYKNKFNWYERLLIFFGYWYSIKEEGK